MLRRPIETTRLTGSLTRKLILQRKYDVSLEVQRNRLAINRAWQVSPLSNGIFGCFDKAWVVRESFFFAGVWVDGDSVSTNDEIDSDCSGSVTRSGFRWVDWLDPLSST